MSKQSFVRGAFILAVAGFLVKVIGFIYQVLIIRLISPEGIGIFNMIYPLYITAMVLLTAGLPLAVAKLVSEEAAKENKAVPEKILGSAITSLLILATGGSLLFIIISPPILSHFYADPRVIPAFMVLLPSLLMIVVSSTIKGFFQGLQDMRPTALNQLLEQVVRFSSGLLLVYLLLPFGLTWAAVGLAASVLLSELAGLIYLLWRLRRYSRTIRLLIRPNFQMLRRLFSFGVPVTITRVVTSVLNSVEAALIPSQLMKAGSSLSQAATFYGELTGIAFTLLMIPSTLTFSLSTSLLPAVSEAHSKNQKTLLRHRTSYALGITLIAGAPCAMILFLWGPLITTLLFKAAEIGYLLQILTLGSIFLYLAQTTTGILQGIGCVKRIFAHTLLAGILRLSGIALCGANARYAISGIAASYVAGFVVVALLNLIVLHRLTGFHLRPAFFLRLGVCISILFIFLENTYLLVADNVILLIALVLASLLVYSSLLLLLGDEHIRMLFAKIS